MYSLLDRNFELIKQSKALLLCSNLLVIDKVWWIELAKEKKVYQN